LFNSLPFCWPGNVVRIVTGYGLDGPGIEPGEGEIFRICPDRSWGLPSLLYNGYRFFPGSKERPGVKLTPHSLLVPWSRKSRAVPLFPLWDVLPVESLSFCTRVHFNLYPFHLFVTRHFSLVTLSLYFLCDMSRNSSCLRTNSVNFFSIFEEKDSTRCKQTLELLWKRRKTVHTVGIERVPRGPDPFRSVPSRHSFPPSNRDVTETFLSVRAAPFNYTRECLPNGTVPWRIVWIDLVASSRGNR
jgi:hypothetical protein